MLLVSSILAKIEGGAAEATNSKCQTNRSECWHLTKNFDFKLLTLFWQVRSQKYSSQIQQNIDLKSIAPPQTSLIEILCHGSKSDKTASMI